jgi:hypothetical protein
MRRRKPSHRREGGFSPVRTRSSNKRVLSDLRSRSSTSQPRPTVEELEAAIGPDLGFIPDPALLPRPRRGRQFLHGPLDWGDICQVFSVSREVAAVWMLIHLRRKLTGEPWITLPAKDLARLRVDKSAKSRALKILESEGFILVQRGRGCSVQVRLVRED